MDEKTGSPKAFGKKDRHLCCSGRWHPPRLSVPSSACPRSIRPLRFVHNHFGCWLAHFNLRSLCFGARSPWRIRPLADGHALSAQLEHAQNWRLRAFAHRFGQSDLWFHVQKRVIRFLEGVHLHEPAFAAKAIICRSGNECLIRDLFVQPM
jgi:hypothetical protein